MQHGVATFCAMCLSGFGYIVNKKEDHHLLFCSNFEDKTEKEKKSNLISNYILYISLIRLT